VRGYLVLSDPVDIEQYEINKKAFESDLTTLKTLSRAWGG
jgi:hypothetical protein